MGIFEDIFGGSQSTSTPVNMNPFTNALQPEITKLGNAGPLQYNGPLTVSPTAGQTTMMGNIANMVDPSNPTNQLIQSATGGGAFLPGGQFYNPYVAGSVSAATNPIYAAMQETLGQNLPAQFQAGGGQLQGSRLNSSGQAPGNTAFTNAEAVATQSFNQAAAQAASSVVNNAYNTGVGATVQFAQLQPQEVQAAINGLQANLLPTLLQEQGITNGLTAFQENVQSLVSFLSDIGNIAQPVVANQGQTTTETGILPALGSLFGGLSGGGKAAGGSSK